MFASEPQAATHRGDHLLLYDGVCGLCNRLTAFVLPRDPAGRFDYASLQSATGHAVLARFGRSAARLDTFYVVRNYRSDAPELLAKSRAALFVLRTIGGIWRCAAPLGLLPTRLLDLGYDVVARYRYRVFGRYDTCPLPDAAHRQRFIDV